MWNKIKCPCCDTGEININLQLLATGKEFLCTQCGTKIGVADSSKEMVKEGVNTFMAMQTETLALGEQKTH
jgi:hypothetical protein